MKFCRDCKYFEQEQFCTSPRRLKTEINPVFGVMKDVKGSTDWADMQRIAPFPLDVFDRKCGRRARFFEAK